MQVPSVVLRNRAVLAVVPGGHCKKVLRQKAIVLGACHRRAHGFRRDASVG